ncbi:MAG: RsmB/NOP family class I SAM-dependent RNA methyltransferase [Eubacterium sp.]|nr:RsmB/NOP family class I SAM-dependent RNA methyltransferase [Eubacterium sp.]
MRLPDSYIRKMQSLLGEEYPLYEASLDEPMNHCLRVNTLKLSVPEFLEICPFELTPVPWTDNAFYYDASIFSPSKHPFYFAGLYYLQEASATLPAATLPIEPGDKVLDICAAPGGKTTELAAKLKGTGVLVSNDISASRLKALQKNVEAFGAENVIITCETPERLASHFGQYFDKILIDAPCSGEGMFRKSSSMVTAWEQNGNEKFAAIQRSILDEIPKLLKPGGMILYSTCTFDTMEDEEQVMYLRSLDPSLEIVPINMCEGFVPGYMIDGADETIKYTAHLFPHRVHGEGHYVSLLKKMTGDEVAEGESSSNILDGDASNVMYNGGSFVSDYKIKSIGKLPDDAEEFLKHIISGGNDSASVKNLLKRSNLELIKDRLFLVPDGVPDIKGLRTMRTGIYIGELKKNRFEPSQSLAMLLKADNFDNVLDLSADSNNVYRYLRGETLDVDALELATTFDKNELKNGWVLVCVAGFPLGFAKNTGGTIKNKYLPGWRMTS